MILCNIIKELKRNYPNNTSINIGFETRTVITKNFLGGVEKDFYDLSLILEKKYNSKCLTVTGDNGKKFEDYLFEDSPYSGPTLYCKGSYRIIEAVESLFESNLIDTIIIGDVWGFESENEENKQSFLRLVEVIKKYPVFWSIINTDSFSRKSFPWSIDLNLTDSFIKNIKQFIPVSKQIEEKLLIQGVPQDKITLIRPHIDMDLFIPASNETEKNEIRQKLQIPIDKTVILYSGRLNSIKGSTWLMKVWPELVKINPHLNLYLAIVGEHFPNYSTTQEWIDFKRNFMQKSIGTAIMTNRFIIDPKELADWYKASDIFLFPSVMNEGIPSSLTKAVAVGLPSITTAYVFKNTGVKELIAINRSGLSINDITPDNYRTSTNFNNLQESILRIITNYNYFRNNTIRHFNNSATIKGLEDTAKLYYKTITAQINQRD